MTGMDVIAPAGSAPAALRLAAAEAQILTPAGLDLVALGPLLGALTAGGADFADLYFERTATERWQLRDGRVATGGYSQAQGVGARALHGDRTAFAYSADIRPSAVRTVVDTAVAMRRYGGDDRASGGVPALFPAGQGLDLYPATDVVAGGDAAARIDLLRRIDAACRDVDPRIVGVTASLTLVNRVVLIAAADGTLAADIRPMVGVSLGVVAESGGRRSTGNAGTGGRFAFAGLDTARLETLVRRATRTALVGLDARAAPSGAMPVVLGPGFPGILLHEAVGHGLEGDAHRKRSSVFAGRMGEVVAAPGVTVVDDATLPGRMGSLNVDDEGVPGERTVLIADGRLTGLMQDRLNARLMNQRPTGNARRQSYAHLPMPRMTNTFLAAGDAEPADIIASVKRGIYADELGGGTVDITTGQFNFGTTRAWLIEDGRLTAPIRGATLIGVGHETLKQISMIGNDLSLDEGEAMCGKQGQSVRVGVGQPTLRIDDMIVGGAGGE
jgi:TldD protein